MQGETRSSATIDSHAQQNCVEDNRNSPPQIVRVRKRQQGGRKVAQYSSTTSRTGEQRQNLHSHAPPPLIFPPRYLHPEELELLKPTMVPSPAAAAAAKSSASGGATDAGARATEEATIPLVPSSKKEASVRRRELLAYLREPLKEACASHAGELMRSKFAGALVLLEAVRVRGRTYSCSGVCIFCILGDFSFMLSGLLVLQPKSVVNPLKTERSDAFCSCGDSIFQLYLAFYDPRYMYT